MYLDATSLSDHYRLHHTEPGAARASLGPRIRRARVERLRGLNLEDFGRQIAELMGRRRSFSNVTISNWETGRQEPSFEALVAISRLTHLPLRYFAGVGEMTAYPFIDWLAPERSVDLHGLETVLRRSSDLPWQSRQILSAQLKSLVDDLYKLPVDELESDA